MREKKKREAHSIGGGVLDKPLISPFFLKSKWTLIKNLSQQKKKDS